MMTLAIPLVSHANIPFGGRIVMMHDCFCSGGWMIYVFDPGKMLILPIVFQFGISRLNASWNIFTPGNQVLGTMIPGGVCSIALAVCTPIPAVGTVTPFPLSGVGTSLLPI